MAKWAKWMFWAIVVQTVLAGGALTALILDLRQNRLSAERQLRAYVTVDKLNMDWVRDEGEQIVEGWFKIEWINTGQTPAIDFQGDINWGFFKGALPDEFDFPPSEAPEETSILVLGPGQGSSTTSEVPISGAELREVGHGERRLYLWGSGEYVDAFGHTRRIELGTRVKVSHLPDGTTDIRFSAISRHNGMDDGCMRPPAPKAAT